MNIFALLGSRKGSENRVRKNWTGSEVGVCSKLEDCYKVGNNRVQRGHDRDFRACWEGKVIAPSEEVSLLKIKQESLPKKNMRRIVLISTWAGGLLKSLPNVKKFSKSFKRGFFILLRV